MSKSRGALTKWFLEPAGPDRVEVRGAAGRPPSDTHKVSATFRDGFRCSAAVMMGGLDAVRKAERTAGAILKKTGDLFETRGLGPFSETSVEVLGAEATEGPRARARGTRGVVLKSAARHPREAALALFSREIAQAATAMAPGLTGMVGGRPKVSPVIRLFSFLVPKSSVPVTLDLDAETLSVEMPSGGKAGGPTPLPEASHPPITTDGSETVPLVKLALARELA
jgi:hypothetical protein